MSHSSLYRRVLSVRFDELPAVLKHFHDAPTGGKARGTLQVSRGAGPLRQAVAALMGLPRAGKDRPVRLEVVVEGQRELWLRHFPERCLSSLQWDCEDLLCERFGLASFSSALVIDGSRLSYEFRRAWFLGIPVPTWLSPYVEGYVEADERRWRTVVRIFAPMLGEIVHYEGWVEPE
jgi:hypothetical protein